MPPETDPHFKAAFADLHRRQCAEAPPVEAMLSRAWRAAETPRRSAAPPLLGLRISIVAASVCLALGGLWSLQIRDARQAASAQRVEQLLASIEQQLELNADFAAPQFPTDILLSQSQTDPTL